MLSSLPEDDAIDKGLVKCAVRKRRLRLQMTYQTINKRPNNETPHYNNKINKVLLLEVEEGEENTVQHLRILQW